MSVHLSAHFLHDTAVFVPRLRSGQFRTALREMIGYLCEGRDLGPDAQAIILNEMLLREKTIGSTDIGNGVAIPHLYLSDLSDWTTRAGWFRSSEGILFERVKGQRVYIVLLTLARNHDDLLLLGQGRELLEQPAFREKLRTAVDEAEMKQAVRDALSRQIPIATSGPDVGQAYCTTVTVLNPMGLHMRPCTRLVTLIKTFECSVVFRFQDAQANGTSLFDLLTFGSTAGFFGSTLEVEVRGSRGAEAMEAIVAFFKNCCLLPGE